MIACGLESMISRPGPATGRISRDKENTLRGRGGDTDALGGGGGGDGELSAELDSLWTK